MKGFFIFFAAVLLLLGAFFFYYINNPKEGMVVRQDGRWTIIEHNLSK